jgi:hypothetical protein
MRVYKQVTTILFKYGMNAVCDASAHKHSRTDRGTPNQRDNPYFTTHKTYNSVSKFTCACSSIQGERSVRRTTNQTHTRIIVHTKADAANKQRTSHAEHSTALTLPAPLLSAPVPSIDCPRISTSPLLLNGYSTAFSPP